jgi:hypothetical protein
MLSPGAVSASPLALRLHVANPRTLPDRHWRSYGTEPLPTAAEALDQPFRAFPSWFLRIECDRCGKVVMVNESHARWRDSRLADILAKMRHEGCQGRAAKRHRGHVVAAGASDRAAGGLTIRGVNSEDTKCTYSVMWR